MDWKKLKTQSVYAYLVLVLIVLTGIVIYGRFSDFNFLSRMLIAPVLLLLSIPMQHYKKPLYAFLVGAGLLMLLSLINLASLSLNHHSIKMDVGSEVNAVLMGERPYLGFIYLICFCLCVYLSQKEKNQKKISKS